MQSIHYIHNIGETVKNNLEQSVTIGSSTAYAKSALLKVVTNCGSFNSFSVISHTGVRDPAYCDPAGGSAGSLFFVCKCDKK